VREDPRWQMLRPTPQPRGPRLPSGSESPPESALLNRHGRGIPGSFGPSAGRVQWLFSAAIRLSVTLVPLASARRRGRVAVREGCLRHSGPTPTLPPPRASPSPSPPRRSKRVA
jgi:hypothetical protein